MEPHADNPPARPGYRPRRRARWGTLALVVAGHLVVGAGLIRAFAPQFPAQAIDAVGSLVTVTITTPPEPTPAPSLEPDPGAAGDEGRRATPREAQAPAARIPVRPTPIPRASSTGSANASGAGEQGSGTGAGGEGSGTGSGAGGGGQGSGTATRPVLVSGAIDDARAYPVPEGGREARIGKSVIVALTVGTDGRPSACRTYRTSGLPKTDAVTCRLALERLRFRPATNARGEPVVGTFYWQQRFFF
jgi:protein TonB